MKRLMFAVLTALLVSVTGCVTQEKSENFLSPTVASPIPGVAISAPTPVYPDQGTTIVVTQQPITLALLNATTSGVRPLSYAFEIASDVNFANIVFSRQGITPGEGQTSLRLPDALASGRSYYWRGRAEDGANTGPYSFPVVFTIANFIGAPTAIAPSGDISTIQPQFVVGNAPRSGTVGQITYLMEIATSEAFTNLVAIWTFNEQPGQTSFSAPGGLPGNTLLFWRVRGADHNTGGGWSNPQAFRTPNVPSPPSGGGGGGVACGPPFPSSPVAIMACLAGNTTGGSGAGAMVDLLRRIAVAFNQAGVDSGGRGPFGLLRKGGGHNCLGYSCDILCAGQGGNQGQWDIWIDGNPQQPVWGGPLTAAGGARVDVCEIP